MMTLNLVACGGEKASTSSTSSQGSAQENKQEAAQDTTQESTEVEYTEEQQALAQEFSAMIDAYNEVVDKVNTSPELLEIEELVTVMNEISEGITEIDGYFADPKNLTPEVMDNIKTVIDRAYEFINSAEKLINEVESGNANS
ncbi:MAG: hypothetical protein PWP07_1056 [Epulopiscium sp.]|nr:hypothetical protein [Defluviitaleaceae bacterium]MDK2787831.1 hypothetical protein [Candidatus Epulonipiscium sp.]HHW68259.1 hypothetical protein [Candidatus Epulonipiscium sp.]